MCGAFSMDGKPSMSGEMPWIDGFLAHVEEEVRTLQYSPATLRAIRQDLRQFATWWESTFAGAFELQRLTPEVVQNWLIARAEDDRAAPATINRGLSSMRRFCAWAADQGLIRHNPVSNVRDIPLDISAPASLPSDGLAALLFAAQAEPNAFLRARDGALLALLIFAGLRVQEICDLQ